MLLSTLAGLILGALVVAIISALVMRPETYCPDCFETIKGWIWEGSDGGLLARWRRHSRESCEERAFQRAEFWSRFPHIQEAVSQHRDR